MNYELRVLIVRAKRTRGLAPAHAIENVAAETR